MSYSEEDINSAVNEELNSIGSQVQNTLSIVVGGKVSSGKSSFLNALFSCKKDSPLFSVGAEAGVTTEPKAHKITENVTVWDTPGLNDITHGNVRTTLDFLEKGHDLSILLLSGAADTTQKENYEILKKNTYNGNVIVVLNKVDGESQTNIEKMVNQWKLHLGMASSGKIFTCVSKGYGDDDRIIDPISGEEIEIPVDSYGIPRTVRGVDDVRKEVSKKLEEVDKDLLFLKSQQSKAKAVLITIAGACVSAGVAAFIPGSGVSITAIQIGAICRLHYLHKGEILSKSQVISILPAYASQAIGRNVFLWAKSFLPPTGILDIAAASIAVTLTTSMLVTINYLLKEDIALTDTAKTIEYFKKFRDEFSADIKSSNNSEWQDKDFWIKLIEKYV